MQISLISHIFFETLLFLENKQSDALSTKYSDNAYRYIKNRNMVDIIIFSSININKNQVALKNIIDLLNCILSVSK